MKGLSIVRVTMEHIEQGRRNSYSFSPIAFAIRARLIDGTIVQQLDRDVFIVRGGFRRWPALPLNVLRFTERFNARQLIGPFSFGMELPPELLRRKRRAPARKPAEVASISHGRDGRISAQSGNKRTAA